ncbi:tetratricopeptide repeat-containing protein [Lewinella sp. 4G2]|uniref:tetratricopeptide repeat-containing protein n=1 Tax=Lewinella sp. 4G2 TaxID=1803372 RepID=UPI0007B4AD8B|nr:tetratricopeptide repeat-containing protein [Lewinella sp. 4G2]OAV43101.1 hypothetical protein A3850_000695 [Lewinella sp. 4G2]
MTNATFLSYLRDPSSLIGVDIDSIGQLTARYPYSANAQLLLALAAELNGHPESQTYLQRAATQTFDREQLFDTLYALLNGEASAAEEFTEEEPTFSLEDLMAPEALLLDEEEDYGAPTVLNAGTQLSAEAPLPIEPSPTNVPGFDDDMETGTSNSSYPTSGASIEEEMPPPPPERSPLPAADHAVRTVETMAVTPPATITSSDLSEREAEPTPSDFSPTAIPQDPADFSVRAPISTKEELRKRLQSIRDRQVARAKEQKKSIKKIARRSLIASEGIISPTLAEVFIQQGQYHHAIRIYEQLALANPEKSPIFAALIQDLKQRNGPDE